MIDPNFEDGVWMLVQVTLILGVSGLLALALRGGRPALASAVLSASLLASAGVALPILYSPLRWSWVESTETRSQSTADQDTPTASDSAITNRPTRVAKSSEQTAINEDQVHAIATRLGWAMDQLAQRWVAPAQVATERVGLTRNQVLTAWIGTAIWAWALLTLGLGMLRRHRRLGQRIDDPQVISIVQDFSRQLSIKRTAELREADGRCEPAMWGVLRPIIVLPRDWQAWAPSELRSVLAHEVSHQARGDWSLLVLARISRAIHLYHPLTHWVFQRLQLEQELAADELAASLLGDSGTYAQSLMRLALRADRQSRLPQPVLAWGGSHLLKRMKEMNRRQTNISMPKRPHRWHRGLTHVALFVGAIATCSLAMGIRPLTADEKPAVEPTPTKKTIYERHGTANDIWVQAKCDRLITDRSLPKVRAIAQGLFEVLGVQPTERTAFSGAAEVRIDRIADLIWDQREDPEAINRMRSEYFELDNNLELDKLGLESRHRLMISYGSNLLRMTGVEPGSGDPVASSLSTPDHAHPTYLSRFGPYTWNATEMQGRQAWDASIGTKPVMTLVADKDGWMVGNRDQLDEFFHGNAPAFGEGVDAHLIDATRDADLSVLIGPKLISLFQKTDLSQSKQLGTPLFKTLVDQVEQVSLAVHLKDEIEWTVQCQMKDAAQTDLRAMELNGFMQYWPLGVAGETELGTAAELLGMSCEADGRMLIIRGHVPKSMLEGAIANMEPTDPTPVTGWTQWIPMEPSAGMPGVALCPVPGARPQLGLVQSVDANEFRGRRIQLNVQTSPIPENAKLRLWAVADGEHAELVSGATVWSDAGQTNATLSWNVPNSARTIAFGASAVGEIVHVSGFSINDIGPIAASADGLEVNQVPTDLGRFSYMGMLIDPNESPVNLDLSMPTKVAEIATPKSGKPSSGKPVKKSIKR